MLEETWQAIPIADRDKAYGIFHKMKPGECFELSRVSPVNLEKFMTIVLYFIKWDEGRMFNFFLELDGDTRDLKNNPHTKIFKRPT